MQVGGQYFSAHKFILNSQTRNFTSQLTPTKTPSSPPTYQLCNKCDDPDVFDAFLHYIYGSHIRFLPPATLPHAIEGAGDGIETTPDTSVISVDENDLTEEYDKYCVDDKKQNDWLDGEEDLGRLYCSNSALSEKP